MQRAGPGNPAVQAALLGGAGAAVLHVPDAFTWESGAAAANMAPTTWVCAALPGAAATAAQAQVQVATAALHTMPPMPLLPGTYAQAPAHHQGPKPTNTSRLRWSPALHSQFVAAVQQLGGPFKATPKCIREVMAVPGLTLLHVKSHLQKYRGALSEPTAAGASRLQPAAANNSSQHRGMGSTGGSSREGGSRNGGHRESGSSRGGSAGQLQPGTDPGSREHSPCASPSSKRRRVSASSSRPPHTPLDLHLGPLAAVSIAAGEQMLPCTKPLVPCQAGAGLTIDPCCWDSEAELAAIDAELAAELAPAGLPEPSWTGGGLEKTASLHDLVMGLGPYRAATPTAGPLAAPAEPPAAPAETVAQQNGLPGPPSSGTMGLPALQCSNDALTGSASPGIEPAFEGAAWVMPVAASQAQLQPQPQAPARARAEASSDNGDGDNAGGSGESGRGSGGSGRGDDAAKPSGGDGGSTGLAGLAGLNTGQLLQDALAAQVQLQRQLASAIEAQRQLQVQMAAHGQFIENLLRTESSTPSAPICNRVSEAAPGSQETRRQQGTLRCTDSRQLQVQSSLVSHSPGSAAAAPLPLGYGAASGSRPGAAPAPGFGSGGQPLLLSAGQQQAAAGHLPAAAAAAAPAVFSQAPGQLLVAVASQERAAAQGQGAVSAATGCSSLTALQSARF